MLAAVLARLPFAPILGHESPYLTFYPAVIIAALIGGTAAGIVTAATAVVASFFWTHEQSFGHRENIESLVFLLSSTLVSIICGWLHRAVTRQRTSIVQLLQRESELVAANRNWQVTFDSSRDALWVLDRERRIVRANRTAETIFGRGATEMAGKHCWEIAHDSAEPIPGCPLARAMQSLQRETTELQKGDRWLEVVVDPIVDAEGRFAGAVHSVSDITARRRAEDALHAEKALSEQLINAQFDTVLLFDPGTGRAVRWNRRFTEVSGYSDAEITTLPAPESYYADEYLNSAREAIATLQTAAYATCELMLRTKSGERIPFDYIASKVHSDGGPLVLWVGRDLTERRALEQSLQRVETHFRLIAENTADIVWLFDIASLRFLYVSPSVLAVRGFTPEEACAQSLSDTLSPESHRFVLEHLQLRLAAFARGEAAERVHTYEFGLRHKDGRIIPAEVVTTLLTNSAGHPDRIVGITRDLTERQKSLASLRESEARYRSLFELESDALFLIDDDTDEILEANRAATLLYGRTHDELVRLRNTDLSAEAGATRRAMQDNATPVPVRHHRRADGSVFPVEIVANNFNWAGRAVHLAAIRDITERLRREDGLRRASLRAQSLLRIAEPRQETDQEFLDRALTEALAITDSRLGYIYHYDEDTKLFTLNTWSKEVLPACRVAEPRTTYNLDRTGIWGEAVRQRRPIILNDFAAAHPLKKGYPEGHVALTRFLTIPVFEGERIIAVVGVANKPADYDEGDIVQLQLLMGSVWRALEHRRAELRIRDQYTLLRGLLEAFDTPVFSLDPDLRYTSFNRPHADAMRALYGAEIALGRHILDYQPPEDRATTEINLRQVLAGSPILVEAYSGTGAARRFFEINHTPIHDGAAQVCGIAVLARDLTARRAMEETLRESESRFRAIVQNADAVIFVLDREGRFELSEGRGLATLHLRPGEVVGRSAFAFYRDTPEVLAGIRDALAGHTVKRVVHVAGLVFDTFLTPRLDAARAVTGVIGLATDLTARVRAEDALHAAKENLEGIVRERTAALAESNRLLDQTGELARVGGWEIDLAAQRLTWTGATRTIHEVPPGYVPTLGPAIEFYAPESRPALAAAVQATIDAGTPFDLELAFVTARGRHLWVRALGEAFREQDRIVKIGGVFQDITERRHAEDELRRQRDQLEQLLAERTAANERLRELDRLKSEFLSTMSHELRTPLNSIIGFTGILVKGLAGPLNPEQQKQLGLVQSSARHLLALINDLLDLSRIESGRIEFQRDAFDFAGVVAEVASFLTPLAQEKGLALATRCVPTQLPLVGDRRRSLQILLNLATNAVKFTSRGEVELSAELVGAHLRVAVRDTGIGIRPDQLPLLFEAFRQLDASHRRHYEGTGLGLHLSKKLLGLLGGEISVVSEPGVGSTFTFTLPLGGTPGSGISSDGGSGLTPDIPPPSAP